MCCGKDAACCDMRGLLSFLILFLLDAKPMNGQSLAGEIGRRKGEKPGPGTIYPALKNLSERGLIEAEKSGKNITYHLTGSGKAALEDAKTRFCRTFMGIFP